MRVLHEILVVAEYNEHESLGGEVEGRLHQVGGAVGVQRQEVLNVSDEVQTADGQVGQQLHGDLQLGKGHNCPFGCQQLFKTKDDVLNHLMECPNKHSEYYYLSIIILLHNCII